MIIRQSNKNDINQLIKMRFEFTAEYKELENDLFESKKWFVCVAEVEGKIVSHVFVEIIDTIPRPGRVRSPFGYVTNVYTVPEYRSKGIGSMIMEKINCLAKDSGLTFIMVWPSETSVKFYEKHGFKRAEEVMENHLDSF